MLLRYCMFFPIYDVKLMIKSPYIFYYPAYRGSKETFSYNLMQKCVFQSTFLNLIYASKLVKL